MDRGERVIVEVPDGLATHLDGEIFAEAARRLDIEVLPPPAGGHYLTPITPGG